MSRGLMSRGLAEAELLGELVHLAVVVALVQAEALRPGLGREEAKALESDPGFRARRWVVERTHSWLNRFRGLLIRWSKKPENTVPCSSSPAD